MLLVGAHWLPLGIMKNASTKTRAAINELSARERTPKWPSKPRFRSRQLRRRRTDCTLATSTIAVNK